MGTQLDELCEPGCNIETVARHLDALDPTARWREVSALSRRAQAYLFDAVAAASTPMTLEALVPSECAALHEVVHGGKNSLPLFQRFQKVFCRPDGDDARANVLWGYNRNSKFVETVVGPGYFVVRPVPDSAELLIDYGAVPPRKPAHWPTVRSNRTRLSFFVYNGTQDIVRRVSKHVCIGRVFVAGRSRDAWFVLCRQPL